MLPPTIPPAGSKPGSLYGRNLVTVTNRAVNPIHHPIKGCDLTPPLVATNQAHVGSFQSRTPPKPDLGRQPGLLPWMGSPWLTSSETTLSFREFFIFEGPQSVVRALEILPGWMLGGSAAAQGGPVHAVFPAGSDQLRPVHGSDRIRSIGCHPPAAAPRLPPKVRYDAPTARCIAAALPPGRRGTGSGPCCGWHPA